MGYKRGVQTGHRHHSLSSCILDRLCLASLLFFTVALTLTSPLPTMKTTVALAFFFTCFAMVHLHNTPPKQPTVEVVEVQEVIKPVPAKVEVIKPATAVAVDLTLVKDRIHQGWPLLCLLPKAYLLKPSLKLACPKLAIEATSKVVKKLAAQGPVRATVNVVPAGQKHPVRVIAV